MRTKVAWLVALIMVVIVLSAVSLNVLNPGSSESRKMLALRNLGHELLITSGDSTSRVMPVRKLDEQTFLIEFENSFSFMPDSLIAVVHRSLAKADFPDYYTVQILNRNDSAVVYAYEVNFRENLSPCTGRNQPTGRYAVYITFSEPSVTNRTPMLAGFALIGLVLTGFVAAGFRNKKNRPEVVADENFMTIGLYKFYPQHGTLKLGTETISLSGKETHLLRLFAENPNELLMRDRLLKEVWEDEGVITGRSLDMFVSKLRKKLSLDPAVTLVNVHGKGYRLEV